MLQRARTTHKKAGLSPGTLVFVGEKKQDRALITSIDFSEQFFRESECESVPQAVAFHPDQKVKWINVDGLAQIEIIEKLGAHFNIHSLLLEDILNTNQRPKFEEYDQHLFVVARMLYFLPDEDEFRTEQISFVIGDRYVISFQEQRGDAFDAVRERLRTGKGRIRKQGADFLAYSLLDALVDNYYVIPEKVGELIEEIEDEVLENPGPKTLGNIHHLRRQLLVLRRAIWPLRETVSSLLRSDSDLVSAGTNIYFRDIYDHIIQVADSIEINREMLTGLLDTYLSSLSNRLNQAMRVLTVIATIFMPLTFIAGIYGMNFKHMPELEWELGYFGVLGVMGFIAVAMLVTFRRKDWI
jgi:magnesium transporter